MVSPRTNRLASQSRTSLSRPDIRTILPPMLPPSHVGHHLSRIVSARRPPARRWPGRAIIRSLGRAASQKGGEALGLDRRPPSAIPGKSDDTLAGRRSGIGQSHPSGRSGRSRSFLVEVVPRPKPTIDRCRGPDCPTTRKRVWYSGASWSCTPHGII